MDPREPDALRRYSLFGGILAPELGRIAERLRLTHFAPGDALIREGDHGSSIYLVVEGTVEASKLRQDGGSRRLSVLGPGATVGEMELIDLQPRSCSVVALEPVTALSIDRADLLALKRENIDTFAILALNLARDLSRRLRLMNSAVAQADGAGPGG